MCPWTWKDEWTAGASTPRRMLKGMLVSKKATQPGLHWTHTLTQLKAILLLHDITSPSPLGPSHHPTTSLSIYNQIPQRADCLPQSFSPILLPPFYLAPHQSSFPLHQTAPVKITNEIHVTKFNGYFPSFSWIYQQHLMVNHTFLPETFSSLGFQNTTLSWFSSYP